MVSQGDEVDQILIEVRLFDFLDEHDAALPKVVLLNK